MLSTNQITKWVNKRFRAGFPAARHYTNVKVIFGFMFYNFEKFEN